MKFLSIFFQNVFFLGTIGYTKQNDRLKSIYLKHMISNIYGLKTKSV